MSTNMHQFASNCRIADVTFIDRIFTTNDADVQLTVTSTNRLSNLCASLIRTDGTTPGAGLDAFNQVSSSFEARPEKQRPIGFLGKNEYEGHQWLLVLRELANGSSSVLLDLHGVMEVEVGLVTADGSPVEKPNNNAIPAPSALASSRRPSFYNALSKEAEGSGEEEAVRLEELGSHDYRTGEATLPEGIPRGTKVGIVLYARYSGSETHNGRPVRMDKSATVITLSFEEELLEAVTGRTLSRSDTTLRTPHNSFRVPKVGEGDAPFVFGGLNQGLMQQPPPTALPLRQTPLFGFPFQQTLEKQVDEWMRKKPDITMGERGSLKAVAEAASEYARVWGEAGDGADYRRVPFLVTPECILSLLTRSDAGVDVNECRKSLYGILHASDIPEMRALGNCFYLTIFLQHLVFCAVGGACFSQEGACQRTLSEVVTANEAVELVPWMRRLVRLLRAVECFGVVLRLNTGMDVPAPPQDALDERIRQEEDAEAALQRLLASKVDERVEFEQLEANVRDRMVAVYLREREMYFEFSEAELLACEHKTYRYLMREIERRGRIQVFNEESACRSELYHKVRDFQNEAYVYHRIRYAVEEQEFRAAEARKARANVESLAVERGRVRFGETKLREVLEEKESRLLQGQQAQHLATIIAEICASQGR